MFGRRQVPPLARDSSASLLEQLRKNFMKLFNQVKKIGHYIQSTVLYGWINDSNLSELFSFSLIASF